MPASFRSGAHTGYGGIDSTSITITKPAGLAVDDIAIVWLTIERESMTITGPSGWAEKGKASWGTGGGGLGVYAWWKKMTLADLSSTWTFSWPTSSWRTGDVVAIQGSTATDPWGGSMVFNGSTTGTSRSSSAYTSTGAGLGVWLTTHYTDTIAEASTTPAGYTNRYAADEHGFRFSTRADAAGSLSSASATSTVSIPWGVGVGTILDADALTAIDGRLLMENGDRILFENDDLAVTEDYTGSGGAATAAPRNMFSSNPALSRSYTW